MQNKIILITGGMGYLGQAITDRLKTAGGEVVNFTGDITNKNNVLKNVSDILAVHAKIDVLIHCASASIHRKPLLALSLDEFESQFKVGVFGLFDLYKAIVPNFSKDAVLVAISTASLYNDKASKIETDNKGSYLLAKKSLNSLLRHIALSGEIRVNTIAPAFMRGGLNRDIPEKVQEFIATKLSKDDMTDKEEVVEVVMDVINKPEIYGNGKTVLVPSLEIKDI
jgi:NAD(P)-dependent dehydrogenase (short-subunit alcohol dehydrogenase family)